jgi:hypothetical protein
MSEAPTLLTKRLLLREFEWIILDIALPHVFWMAALVGLPCETSGKHQKGGGSSSSAIMRAAWRHDHKPFGFTQAADEKITRIFKDITMLGFNFYLEPRHAL